MSLHEPHCVRGGWLIEQHREHRGRGGLLGLLAVVLFQEGPACTCRTVHAWTVAEAS